MKKVILASVLTTVAMTSMVDANAATSGTVCAGPTSAGNGTMWTVAAGEMVVNTFTPKCSANVHLVFDQGAAYFRVGSVNVAGSRSFRGSTAGGSVTSDATCSGTGNAASNCGVGAATTARDSASNPTSG